jgi:cation transport ATPase
VRTIRQNLFFFAFLYNSVMIPCHSRVVEPLIAVFAMFASSLGHRECLANLPGR